MTKHAHAEYIPLQAVINEPATLQQQFLVELLDNNASDDGLSLSMSVAVNEQTWK